MALIKWNPELSLFPAASWWSDFFNDEGEWVFPGGRGMSMPAVNIAEKDDAYTVEVAAPGFQKDHFRIEVKNGYLILSGEQREEKKEEEKGKYTRREFRYGSFSRSFALPDDVDEARIRARYNDGILEVTLPKKEAAPAQTAKSIAIE